MVGVRRIRLQYKKALDLPFLVISLAHADGAVIEQSKTAAGVWDKANQVIVMDVTIELSTLVSAISPGEPFAVPHPKPCGIHLPIPADQSTNSQIMTNAGRGGGEEYSALLRLMVFMACGTAGARLFFQVMHYKPKEAKDSLLAWSYVETDTLFPKCAPLL